VVLLGAGLDTRAFRLQWPTGLRLFELDLPEVLAFKERVLSEMGAKARCRRSAGLSPRAVTGPVALFWRWASSPQPVASGSPKAWFRILRTMTPTPPDHHQHTVESG
jgi:Leucine carboxyl methyltransferase